MSNTVIRVEGISKQYRLGEVSTGTMVHDLNRWWHKVRGKENPYLQIGEVNDRTEKGSSEYVWAIKGISFDVKQGEVLGIIGRNGAGKSTLLKILSKVTQPTIGDIKIKGRIASLLEVGTGFHPELSGRDNIFLNGAILGMSKREIKNKFDEIVDFAGVERYIDTPVKRYSSGMYVRLAFAVAAHLEPEILIIDEVLAVGDAEFQRKCLGKMKEVSVNHGRTVLFVSHNMAAVKQLCTRGVVLQNGALTFSGSVADSVNHYQKSGNTDTSFEHHGPLEEAPGNSNIKLLGVTVAPLSGEVVAISSGLEIEVRFYNYKPNINLAVSVVVKSFDEVIISELPGSITENRDSKEGKYSVKYEIPANLLNAGTYYLNIVFGENSKYVLYDIKQVIQFEVLNEAFGDTSTALPGFLRLNQNAKHQFIG